MSKPVFLSDTAYVSLYEIKSRQIDKARLAGYSEEESQTIGATFVADLLKEAIDALSGITTWPVDPQMASRGYPFRKWRQKTTGFLCHHEVTGSEIQVHYFCHGKTDYVNAFSRLTTVYTYVPFYLPGDDPS
ncbi:hypothetical protein [Cronobacter dublinensis]|uniref:hypothetical protein n=1 Tax=Cronobacter dublinensis TaxID=413497 RepID=UPI000CFBB5B6|nr:hypothetical protein [Cronobacter dublinensis]